MEPAGLARQFINSKLTTISSFLQRTYGAELPQGPGDDPDVLERFIAKFGDPEPAATAGGDADFDFRNQ